MKYFGISSYHLIYLTVIYKILDYFSDFFG